MLTWTKVSKGEFVAQVSSSQYYSVVRTYYGPEWTWNAKFIDDQAWEPVTEGDIEFCVDKCEAHAEAWETERRLKLAAGMEAAGWESIGGGGYARREKGKHHRSNKTPEELYESFKSHVPPEGLEAFRKMLLGDFKQPCPDCRNNEKARNCPTCGADYPG